ncbi:sporozoite surface protein 2-like [Anneissia japonica]|uniref:sporozoite surface protein 2-like n=1 Tax=Anneissia japonica TaxID=1529436 RepID=UPI0014256CAD|nr:sporozoite surface protein 2-like [Anneissia japonica]
MDTTGTGFLAKFTQAMPGPFRRKRSPSLEKIPVEKLQQVDNDEEVYQDDGPLVSCIEKRPQLPTPLLIEEDYDYTLDWKNLTERNTSLCHPIMEAPVDMPFYENIKIQPSNTSTTLPNDTDQKHQFPILKSEKVDPRSDLYCWNTEHQDQPPVMEERRINAVPPFSKARLEINKEILAKKLLSMNPNIASTLTDDVSKADGSPKPSKAKEPTGDADMSNLYMNSMCAPNSSHQLVHGLLPQSINLSPHVRKPRNNDKSSESISPPPLPVRPYAHDDLSEPVSPPSFNSSKSYTGEKPSTTISPWPHLPPRPGANEKPSTQVTSRPPLPNRPKGDRKPSDGFSRRPLLPIRPDVDGLQSEPAVSPQPYVPKRPNDEILSLEPTISSSQPLPVRPYMDDNASDQVLSTRPNLPTISSSQPLPVRPYIDDNASDQVLSTRPNLPIRPNIDELLPEAINTRLLIPHTSYSDEDNQVYEITRRPVNCLTVQQLIEQVRLLGVREHVIDRIRENLVDGPLIANMDKSLISEALNANPLETLKIYEFVHKGWKPNI